MNTEPFESRTEPVNRDKLVQDLKTVLHDAEELIKATAGEFNDATKEARQRLAATVESARTSLNDLEDKAIASARATDKLIREHPYPSIGVAVGLGLVLGLLVNRR
jgi:ElaB/YqjD/DUF883 family membrane-anchored ribosome-binding protein